MQLIIRGSDRINNVKVLLDMASDKLISFKHIPKEGEESLCLNEAEIALIRYILRDISSIQI